MFSIVTESKLNATSFVAKSFNNYKRSYNNNNNTRGSVTNNREPNPNFSSKDCGMIGHTIEGAMSLLVIHLVLIKASNPIKQSGF